MSYILWQASEWLPIAIIVAIATIALVWWLYPSQVRTLNQPWRWVLPGLRIAAMLALAFSILKPVIVRPKTAQEEGAILVLVDRSRSMSVNDAGRTPAQLVALADGMGRIPDGARTKELRDAARRLEALRPLAREVFNARGQLDTAKVQGQNTKVAEERVSGAVDRFKAAAKSLAGDASASWATVELPARLRAFGELPDDKDRDAWLREVLTRIDSANAAAQQAQTAADEALYQKNQDVRKVCDELAGLSRLELVEEALTDPKSGLLDKLPQKSSLYGFGIADTPIALPLRAGDQNVRRLMLEPTGRSSNITANIRDAMDTLKGQTIQAVVVFSDGRQVGGEGAVTSALSASGVPIYTIPAAGNVARDISIERVKLPTSAFAGETVTVEATLHGTGVKGTAVEVTLKIDPDIEQKQIVKFPDEGVLPVRFQVKIDKPGAKQATISVAHQDGESTYENNDAKRWIKVMSDKIKVAAIASEPGWDFGYLRNMLARNEALFTLSDYTLESENQKLPMTTDTLRDADVVILHDVAAASLSDEQWNAVHTMVKDRGGSVVIIAGNSHVPAEYAKHVLLSNFLPFRAGYKPTWRAWPGEEPYYHIIPSEEGGRVEALHLAGGEDALARWQTLPPFFRYLVLPKAAEAGKESDLKPNTRSLLIEREGKTPVLTESRLGLGRVFFIGIDETWRWRYKIGERDQDRFWLQLVRYAAEEPYAVKSEGMALDAEKLSIEPGGTVKVRARVMDKEGLPSKEQKQDLRVMMKGRTLQTIPLNAMGAETGRYEGVVTGLGEGQYTLQLVASDKLDTPVEFPLSVAQNGEAEVVDLSGDVENLKTLANASGGEMVPMERLDTLPSLLAAQQETKSRLAELSLWDSYYLFLFVLACLGAEWALRKRFGLA